MGNGNDDAVLPPHSASTIAATTRTGCHTLRIDGYSATKLASKSSIQSCRFQAAGHAWRIHYYPNMHGRRFVLFLILADDDDDEEGKAAAADVLAKFRFSFVPHGRRHKTAALAPETTPPPWAAGEYKTYTFPGGSAFSSSLGLSVDVSELEKAPEYLHGDFIIVRCEIAVVYELVVNGDDCPGKLAPVCSCHGDDGDGDDEDEDDGLCKRHHIENIKDEDDGLCKHQHADNIKEAVRLNQALVKFFFGCLPLWNN